MTGKLTVLLNVCVSWLVYGYFFFPNKFRRYSAKEINPKFLSEICDSEEVKYAEFNL